MRRRSYLILGGMLALAGTLQSAAIADDDDDEATTYELYVYNGAGDSGTVYVDGNVVCTLQMKQSCTPTIPRDSTRHTVVFHATAGYEARESFDARTCGDITALNFEIKDNSIEITCNGLSF